MTLRVGWFTSPGDPRTLATLDTVLGAIEARDLDVEITYVVVAGRARGADGSPAARRRVARSPDTPVVPADPERFRVSGGPSWRDAYENDLVDRIRDFGSRGESTGTLARELGFLVGYRWIAGPVLRHHLRLVNVHPAPPGGPTGLEASVIDAQVRAGSREGGLTAHVVTEELDRGPALTTTNWTLPDRSDVWPRRVLARADLRDAIDANLTPFCLSTLDVLARADLRHWPPDSNHWPIPLPDRRPG